MLADPALKAVVSDPKAVSKILAFHAIKGAQILPPFKAREETLPTLLAGQSLNITKVGGARARAPGSAPRPPHCSRHRCGRAPSWRRWRRTRPTALTPCRARPACRQVVSPRATGNIGRIKVTPDYAGAKPVFVKSHNIIAGASFIDGAGPRSGMGANRPRGAGGGARAGWLQRFPLKRGSRRGAPPSPRPCFALLPSFKPSAAVVADKTPAGCVADALLSPPCCPVPQ